MKKFLTMLLALSVVFTYTFGAAGSVFAANASDSTIQSAIGLAYNSISDDIDNYAEAHFTYPKPAQGLKVDADAAKYQNLVKADVDKAIEAVKLQALQALQTQAQGDKSSYAEDATADVIKADLLTKVDASTYTAKILRVKDAYANALTNALGAYANQKAAYVKASYDPEDAAAIDAVITTAVTGTDVIVDGNKTLAAVWSDANDTSAETALGQIANVVGATDTLKTALETTYKTAAQKDAAMVTAKSTANKYAEDAMAAFVAAQKDKAKTGSLAKIAEGSDAAAALAREQLKTLDADAAGVLAWCKNQIAAVKLVHTTTALDNAELAKLATTDPKGSVINAIDALTALNDLGTSYSAFAAKASKTNMIPELKKAAQDKAVELKAELDPATAEKVYNDSTVDAKLADVVEKIESLTAGYDTVENVNAKMIEDLPTAKAEANANKAVDSDRTAAKDAIKNSAAINTGSYKTTKLYAENQWADPVDGKKNGVANANKNLEATKAIRAEYTAKIETATYKTELVALVNEAREKMDKYPRATEEADVAGYITSNTTGYVTQLKNLADAKDFDTPNTYTKSVYTYKTGILASLETAVTSLNAVMTVDEVKAALAAEFANQKEVVKNLSPDSVLDTKKAEIEAIIAALPIFVTINDKAAIIAAKKAYDEYVVIPGASAVDATKLNSALTGLKTLVVSPVKEKFDAVKTLSEAEAVKTENRAKIADTKDAIEAFVAEFDGVYTISDIDPSAKATMETLLGYLTAADAAADLQACLVAVNAIPAKVTLDDKATVEAARAAFEKLSDAVKATKPELKAKIEAAEAAIVAAENADEAEKALEEAIKAKEEAEKAAADAKEEADKAKQEAADAKEAAEKAEADKIAAEKEAADAKEAADKAAAEAEQAAKDKAAAEAAKAEAEAAQAAAEKALADAQTKIKVMNTTAKVSKATATKTSVKLTFAKPAVGANGYKVYMATSKTGTYKLVGTVTGTTFTKKSLKSGKTYYFKVKAYKTVAGAKVYTKTSAIKTVKTK